MVRNRGSLAAIDATRAYRLVGLNAVLRRLGLDGDVPDHSTFSKNRFGRFRECDLLRGTFSRADFTYDHEQDIYRCPGGNVLGPRH